MKVSNIFLMPKETKLCSLCEKEINKKWKDELCESCRTNLDLYPELKDIKEIFKITSSDKKTERGGTKMAKEKNEKSKTNTATDLGKRVAVVFFENEMPDIVKGLKLDKEARQKEISNAIRKLVGVEELTITKSTKRKAVIEKLGLSADATQKDINEAILALKLK